MYTVHHFSYLAVVLVYSVLTLTYQYTDSSIYIGRAQLAEKGSADFRNFSQSSLFGGSKVLAELHRVEKQSLALASERRLRPIVLIITRLQHCAGDCIDHIMEWSTAS